MAKLIFPPPYQEPPGGADIRWSLFFRCGNVEKTSRARKFPLAMAVIAAVVWLAIGRF